MADARGKKLKPFKPVEKAAVRHEAMDLLANGFSVDQAADQLGVSAAAIYTWLKDPDLRERYEVAAADYLARSRAVGRQLLIGASVKAIETIAGLLDCPNPAVRLKAAQDILDRLGYRSPDKLIIEGGMGQTTSLSSLVGQLDGAEKAALIQKATVSLTLKREETSISNG